jgi:alpha,alpha-trehalose phosphorylase
MAQQNLHASAQVVSKFPERARELGVDEEEASDWHDAAYAITCRRTTN